jgi:PKD repeat protein
MILSPIQNKFRLRSSTIYLWPMQDLIGQFIKAMLLILTDCNLIVRYIWDFGDGKGSLARVTTHIYNDIGVYYVTLIVIDSYGAISKDECVITVLNELPTPSIEIYQDVNFGLRVTGEKWHKVKLGVLEDGDEIDSLEIIREPGDPDDQSKSFSSHLDIRMRNELKVEFEFFNDSNFHGSNPSWVNISLEGWNETIFYEFNLNDGIYQQKTYEINNILSRGVITFDGSSSYDKEGNILDYLWNFGDGTSSTDPVKEKQYLQDGLYEVLLTVEDDDGAINTYSI